MLTIRLQRVGRKNQAAFRIVLAEKQKHVKKDSVEILGHYNPRNKEFGLKDEERVKYWLGQHVEVSPTVHNLFVEKGLVEGSKKSAWRPKVKEKTEEETPKESPKATDVTSTDAPSEKGEDGKEPEANTGNEEAPKEEKADEGKEETKPVAEKKEEPKEEAKPEGSAEKEN